MTENSFCGCAISLTRTAQNPRARARPLPNSAASAPHFEAQSAAHSCCKMAMKLAYWDIRGLAQPIRLLLEYTGTKYEEKFYSCGEAPNYDKSCWFNEKEKLGMDFPNLPYLEDGGTKVVQSNAILRYIARKHNLCGETEEEQMRVDILENQAMDFRNGFAQLCYGDFDKNKPCYNEKLPGTLKQFSDFLGDRKWFAGHKITFVDFIMYELLDLHRMFQPECLDDYRNLRSFLDHFESLEKIAEYMKSGKFIKTPVNNKMAKWGNRKE
uniref:glutathione transferase n=3 Tax=Cyprinus carpio TaxID=7962 RepID=A0A8C1TZK7_CYPCA